MGLGNGTDAWALGAMTASEASRAARLFVPPTRAELVAALRELTERVEFWRDTDETADTIPLWDAASAARELLERIAAVAAQRESERR